MTPALSLRLNAVILKGRNDNEVLDLLEYAMRLGVNIAYIEEMPLGEVSDHDRLETTVSNDDVRKVIEGRYPLTPVVMKTAGPSRYYRIENSPTKVGFISPVSHNFCDTCNRVRVTVEGRLLLSVTMDDLKRRLVRYRLRHEGEAPDAARLGTVLHRNGSGRLWQAVIQDPVAEAVTALRAAAGVAEFEETSLTLEEAYSALVAREEAL